MIPFHPNSIQKQQVAFLSVRATWGRKYQHSLLQGAGVYSVLSPDTGTSKAGVYTHSDTDKDADEQVGPPLHLPMTSQTKETHDTKSFMN